MRTRFRGVGRYRAGMLRQSFIVAVGESDCESLGDGFLLQPANALSSLAFSIAGGLILVWAARAHGHERVVRLVVGFTVVLTGFGSLLYHGVDSTAARILHDGTFLATIWVLAVVNLARTHQRIRSVMWSLVLVGIGGITAAAAVIPRSTNLLAVVVVAAFIAADVRLRRLGLVHQVLWTVGVGAMGIAITALVVGRTGSPLCEPNSLFQGHALLHGLAAVAITLYVAATSDPDTNRIVQ